MKNTTFEQWFEETELFSTRAERFYNDLDHHKEGSKGSYMQMKKWLQAAYNAGRE